MKAVVLAAGKGARLAPLTETIPKPMLLVQGRPVIDNNLARLARSGIREIYMNLHHRPGVLQEYCGDGSRWGLKITYAVETELLGTAGAVRNFSEHLGNSPFFVVYGDNYLETDPTELWTFHHERRALATIGLCEKADVTGSGIVQLDTEGRIVRFVEKPRPSEVFSHLVNGGLYVCSQAIASMIPNTVPCDFSYHVFPALLASGHRMYGRVMAGRVWGIDTPELYRELCEHKTNELS